MDLYVCLPQQVQSSSLTTWTASTLTLFCVRVSYNFCSSGIFKIPFIAEDSAELLHKQKKAPCWRGTAKATPNYHHPLTACSVVVLTRCTWKNKTILLLKNTSLIIYLKQLRVKPGCFCPTGWWNDCCFLLSPCLRPPRRYLTRATVPLASVSFGQIVPHLSCGRCIFRLSDDPAISRICLGSLYRLLQNTGRTFDEATKILSTSAHICTWLPWFSSIHFNSEKRNK